MSVFSGLGAGTSIDPYQITTVAQLREMNNFTGGGDVYIGTGSTLLGSVSRNYLGLVSTVIRFELYGLNGVSGISIINGGSGYVVGDIVTLVGGNSDVRIRISAVSGGIVTGASVYNYTYGSGYSTPVDYNVSNISGSMAGSGLIIRVVSLHTLVYSIKENGTFVKYGSTNPYYNGVTLNTIYRATYNNIPGDYVESTIIVGNY